MPKYVSKETNQEIEQLIPATVAMNLLVSLQGFARLMDNGHQKNQPANVWVCNLANNSLNANLSDVFKLLCNITQLSAPLFLIHQMGE